MIEHFPPGTYVRPTFGKVFHGRCFQVIGRSDRGWVVIQDVEDEGRQAGLPDRYLEVIPSPLQQLAEAGDE